MSKEFKLGDLVKWNYNGKKEEGVITGIHTIGSLTIDVTKADGRKECFTLDGKYWPCDEFPVLKHRKPKKPKHTIIADSVPRPYLTTWKAVADDGWITWEGGDCPVPYGTKVMIELRTGEVLTVKSNFPRWNHAGLPADIVAYRIHKDQS